jgi:HlyD family secretion protein
MNRFFILTVFIFCLTVSGCKKNGNDFDASGTFEAVETVISSEANGKIISLDINEGDVLKAGQPVGFIDSTQLLLTRQQLMQNRKAILTGRPSIQLQLDALQKELDNALSDRERISNLVKGDVASRKQLDDADIRISVLKAKIEAQKNSLQTTSASITEQGGSVGAQLNLLEDQIRKCTIVNPVEGTVLTKYAEANEMTAVGKPLYKIADLRTMILRVYISGNQLAQIKLNQPVRIFTDNGEGGRKESGGVVSWISDKAEFTPKTIQTKDERANLVYAVKVRVKNDGTYKIGMYGEIRFQ